MITLACEKCGQNYAPARGHDCPEGASRPPIPWKDRKADYHRRYMADYMHKKRAEAKARADKYRIKAEELTS